MLSSQVSHFPAAQRSKRRSWPCSPTSAANLRLSPKITFTSVTVAGTAHHAQPHTPLDRRPPTAITDHHLTPVVAELSVAPEGDGPADVLPPRHFDQLSGWNPAREGGGRPAARGWRFRARMLSELGLWLTTKRSPRASFDCMSAANAPLKDVQQPQISKRLAHHTACCSPCGGRARCFRWPCMWRSRLRDVRLAGQGAARGRRGAQSGRAGARCWCGRGVTVFCLRLLLPVPAA